MKYVLTIEVEGPDWPATPICDDIENFLKMKGEGNDIVGLTDDYLINANDPNTGFATQNTVIRVKVKEIDA